MSKREELEAMTIAARRLATPEWDAYQDAWAKAEALYKAWNIAAVKERRRLTELEGKE